MPREALGPLLGRVAVWLRPGGRLLASFGASDEPEAGMARQSAAWRRSSAAIEPEVTLRLVREAGLEVASEELETIAEPDGDAAPFLWVLAQRPQSVGSRAVEVRRVGVVGLGTMGAGIAQVCVQAGFETVGREVTEELCGRARQTIEHYLARGVEKGRLTEGERDAALGRLTTTTDLAGLAGSDLVIEAIVEELEPKRALFAELSALLPDAILATNTSALSVTEIAGAAAKPERVVGLHFFNPAPVLPLVEVVRTELVDEAVYEAAYAFAAALGRSRSAATTRPGSSSTGS